MTKQEFDALGITKYDLVGISTGANKYAGSVSCSGFYSRVWIGSYPNMSTPCHQSHLIEIKLDHIESIEIIRKNFWSEA